MTLDALRLDYTNANVATEFAESLRQWGFAVISHCPIAPELIAAVYGEWAGFFNSEQKYHYTFDPQVQSGFFPWLTEHAKDNACPDLKEFYHLYPGAPLPQQFSPQTWQLFQALETLATELLGWLEHHCPSQNQFSQPLGAMITASDQTLLRLLHYPPLGADVPSGSIRAAAHEDVNLLTLLPAATASGLEILDLQGHWHPVPSNPGDIVINVGDMLQLVSRGYYRSTTHRVVNPNGADAEQSRYSMPLFLHPRSEVILAENLTAKQFLSQRLQEIGLL
jgi:isopenicillin N synthase-like dioxygenase